MTTRSYFYVIEEVAQNPKSCSGIITTVSFKPDPIGAYRQAISDFKKNINNQKSEARMVQFNRV
tara:strand:- start:26486 stop:26677 length:192 start_codon:yes stop_codon:yes gene_type:complete